MLPSAPEKGRMSNDAPLGNALCRSAEIEAPYTYHELPRNIVAMRSCTFSAASAGRPPEMERRTAIKASDNHPNSDELNRFISCLPYVRFLNS